MLGVLRGRTPLGASMGQNPAVAFYVATMFTLIVLVMHVWLRKHNEEAAARLAASHHTELKRRGGNRTNNSSDDRLSTPPMDTFPDEFAFYSLEPPTGNSTTVVANVDGTSGAPFMTTTDAPKSDDNRWYLKWFRKKPGLSMAMGRRIKTLKLPVKVH